MRFLVDAQLPPALARWLQSQGFEAWHVSDLQLSSASDCEIWRQAKESEAVLISKDEDFFQLATKDPEAPPLIWLRGGNASRRTVLQNLGPLLDEIVARLRSGDKVIEILS